MKTKALEMRLRSYFGAKTFADAKKVCPEIATERARYDPEGAWKKLKSEGHFKLNSITPFLLFPLDQRYIYYATNTSG